MSRRARLWIAVGVLLVALSLGIFLLAGRGGRTAEVASGARRVPCAHAPIHTAKLGGEARIVNVTSGSAVLHAIDPLEGAYRNLAPGARLWILVYSWVGDRYFPTGAPAVLRDGRFRSAAFLGGRVGERSELVAVLADERGSRAISRVVALWGGKHDFVGLTESDLPVGLDEKDCVRVVLRARPSSES